MRGLSLVVLLCVLLCASCEEEGAVEGTDLQLSRIVIPDATALKQGLPIQVQVVVRNNGTETVPAGFATTLTFYEDAALSEVSPVWPALSWIQAAELAPGESVAYTATTLPAASEVPALIFCLAKCDSSDSISEVKESNNTCLKVCQVLPGYFQQIKSDLVVKTFAVPSSVVRGSDLPVSVTIQNIGIGTATAPFSVKVEAFSDSARTIYLWEPQIVEITSDLPSLGEQTVNMQFSVRLTDPLQEVYMLATVDCLGQVAEAVETNNTSEATTEIVLPSEPDLHISAISAPEQVPQGSSANILVTVKNSGGGTAEAPFYVSLGFYSDEACTTPLPGHPELTWMISANLGPGTECSHEFLFATTSSDQPGPVYLKATADSTGTITEANEMNNSLASTTYIVFPPKPDLIVEILSCTDPLDLDGTLTLGYRVTNIGSADALSSLASVSIWNDQNQLVETFGPFGVGPLAVGQSLSFTQNIDPSEANPLYHIGYHHTLIITVDSNDQISEEDELNNSDLYILMVY